MPFFISIQIFDLTNRQTGRQVGEQESRQKDRQTDVQNIENRKIKYSNTDVQTYMFYADRKTPRHTDGQTGGQTDRYRETDSQTAGQQAVRQTDTLTERQTEGELDRQTLKYLLVLYCLGAIQTGKQAGRWVGRQICRYAGKKAGRQESRRAETQAGRQECIQTEVHRFSPLWGILFMYTINSLRY
jgi:hypothetical protein